MSQAIALEVPERRARMRVRAARRASVVFDGTELPCIIVDRSDGGMRLRFTVRVSLPAHFHVSEELAGRTRAVRLVWASAGEVGVAYLPADAD